MNFEDPQKLTPEQEIKEEEREKLEKLKLFQDTRDFDSGAYKNPEAAEEWMNAAFEEDERYQENTKWLEDRQRKLLNIYCEQGNKEGAIRMVEQTLDPFSQQGRIKKFEVIFGEKYSEEKQELRFENNPNSDKKIVDSNSFKQVLLQEGRRGIKKGEEWLEEQERKEKYDPEILHDRRKELNQAKKYWGEK